ncbi:MAG: carboxypeptidase regulatory-like domain-containing protein [Chloroflexi bacterium]|nr:carboxypeptidase regulatory-like domain-containing protein [Chloroflexota bacterium]
MKRFITTTFLALTLFLAACGGNAGDGGTGIKGEVYLAECEGDQIAADCFSQEPYRATLVIYNAAFEEIARVETEADGTFVFDLEPGTYFVHPESPGPYPIANDYQVTVAEGERTELIIIYDSGAR